MKEIIYLHNGTSEQFTGEVEIDESYFGASHKGKRGHGAIAKLPVFGLLKSIGKVYTVMIPDAKTKNLMPIIREKVEPHSIVYSDFWHGYNALDVSEFKHYCINHSELFTDKHNHINGIPREHFHLFLKDCEWRFNNSGSRVQLKPLNNEL